MKLTNTVLITLVSAACAAPYYHHRHHGQDTNRVATTDGSMTAPQLGSGMLQGIEHMLANNPLFNDARAHLTNGAQRIQEVVNMVKKDPSRAGATVMTALIAGLDGQTDASLGTIFNLSHYLTFGLSDPLASFILGPFFQSVTDGLEIVVGNLIGGSIDMALSPLTGSLQKNINRLIHEGKQYHMNVDKLASLNAQLKNSIPKIKN